MKYSFPEWVSTTLLRVLLCGFTLVQRNQRKRKCYRRFTRAREARLGIEPGVSSLQESSVSISDELPPSFLFLFPPSSPGVGVLRAGWHLVRLFEATHTLASARKGVHFLRSTYNEDSLRRENADSRPRPIPVLLRNPGSLGWANHEPSPASAPQLFKPNNEKPAILFRTCKTHVSKTFDGAGYPPTIRSEISRTRSEWFDVAVF